MNLEIGVYYATNLQRSTLMSINLHIPKTQLEEDYNDCNAFYALQVA